MVVYSYKDKSLLKRDSLWESLQIPKGTHKIISLVGGGGKTSVMYELADELTDRGMRVIVTTSTHIFCPTDRTVVVADLAKTVGRWIDENRSQSAPWSIVTGRLAPKGKLMGLPLEEIRKLVDFCDILLIESDGAKQLPFKIPREGEPVLIPETEVVIGCVGLDCIGKTLEEGCFRPELAPGIITSIAEDEEQEKNHIITTTDVAEVLTSEKGTKKNAGLAQYRIVLNKADDEKNLNKAIEVIQKLEPASREFCVVTSFSLRKTLQFHMRIRIFYEEHNFGPGVSTLMKQVREKGSLSSACQEMHMAYSKAWKIIHRAEEDLGFPLMEGKRGGEHGGNTVLTERGAAFLKQYEEFTEEAEASVAEIFHKYYPN